MRSTPVSSVFLVLAALPAARGETLLWTVAGAEAGGATGTAVAMLGDVNGDGHGDFAVGEPWWGQAPSIPDVGRVRAYSGQTGGVLWSRGGSTPLQRMGTALASGADYDGDGVDDLLVGSPGTVSPPTPFGQAFYGAVEVISGATGAVLKSVIGSSFQGSGFGEVLAWVPDISGDGVPEFVVGLPRQDVLTSSGTTLVEAGEAEAFFSNGAFQYMRGGAAFAHFGAAVAGLADIDGDGRGEVAVGIPDVDQSLPTPPFVLQDVGRIELFHLSGNPFALGTPFQSVSGGLLEGLRLGAVLAAGSGSDVDGDGVFDLVAGCPDVGAGLVRVYSGKHLGLLQVWNGDSSGDQFGAAVAGAGDVNGDGHDDVVIGAPGDGDVPQALVFNRGVVSLRSGVDGAAMDAVAGSSSNGHFGRSVAGGADVDLDGRPDVIGGAPGVDSGAAVDAGLARVYRMIDFPAAFANVGSGVAGTNGVPVLTLTKPPETCHATSLVLGNSAGVTVPTTLFMSTTFQPTPTGFGGTLYTVPIVSALGLTLPPIGVTIPFSLPCDSMLWGGSIYLQQLVADASAVQGVAFSQALKVTFGGF